MPPEQAHGRLDEIGPRSDVLLLRNKAIAASLLVALGALLTVVYVNVREAGDLERANRELVEARDRAQAREEEATRRSNAADLVAYDLDEMLEEAWKMVFSRQTPGGDLHKALARVRRIDGIRPADGSWHAVLGALLYRTGDHEAARKTLMEVLQTPASQQSELCRCAALAFGAMALARLNRPTEADQLLIRLRSTAVSKSNAQVLTSALLREAEEVLGASANDPARKR